MVNKEEESVVDSSRSNFEARQDEEINLYVYWKVLVKRKKIFIGIFLVPLVIVTIVSLSLPRYYRGESEISDPAIPAPNIVNLVGDINDTQKVKIFTNNPGAIKSALISPSKKSTDKVSIIIDAKTADIIPQAFKDIHDYINNLPEIKGEIARIHTETDLKIEEADFKLQKLIEAKKANLIYLNHIMMKKWQLMYQTVNPADLIEKDADLTLKINNLQQAKKDMMMKKELNVKVPVGMLRPPSITKQPSNSQIKQRIIMTGILSLFAGIFVVFFLEYIDRIKAREK